MFLLGTVGTGRGGLTRAVLHRIRIYARAGVPVRLLLTGHSPSEDVEEASVRREWELPENVEFRYFWREAAPSGGGAPTDPALAMDDEPGFVSFPEQWATGMLVRCYHDGLLHKTKRFDGRHRLQRIVYHDHARRVIRTESCDAVGRLVRADEGDPERGVATIRRWFDRSGACWLTTWLTSKGKPTKAMRHLPTPKQYDDFSECVAEWIDDVLADSASPVVFSDTRNQDRAVLAMTHPTARRVAVLHNCHTTRPHGPDDAFKGNWLPLMENLTAFDTVVTLTRRQRDDIARRVDHPRLRVINHPAPAPADIGPSPRPPRIVAIARLEGQKRLDHAIKAFARASERVPHARFDIYGRGSQEGALTALVTTLGVSDKVRLRGFTERPLEEFANSAATVLTSWFEGWALTLTEAMATGTPAIAYDVNYGPAEIIRHGVDGLLVRAGDIDGLADAMVRVLSDVDLAARLGERAREVVTRFPAERAEREWLELHAELAAVR